MLWSRGHDGLCRIGITLMRSSGSICSNRNLSHRPASLPVTDRRDKCSTKGLSIWESPNRVRFLGFANQSALPAVYKAADLIVLPSEFEPFAVVVTKPHGENVPLSRATVMTPPP